MWYNLMTDEERENTEFVINLSYGKDSLAAIHVAVDILKIPIRLIRIVHAEVWATDTIPADLPPMVEFKRWADGFIKGRWGLTVEHVCATRGGGRTPTAGNSTIASAPERTRAGEKASRSRKVPGVNGSSTATKLTYEDIFYRSRQKESGGRAIYGFPMAKGNWCTSNLKTAAASRLRALQPSGASIAPENSKSRSFPMAPGGEGRRKISSIFWALQPMSLSASLGT
jgi:hypothetical protein